MPSNDLGADPKQHDPSVRLRVSGLSKSFGSVRALKSVNFDLRPGEVHALCGENGAGKSTLIKLLGGVYAHGSYEGTIEVEGKEAKFQRTKDAEAAGICVIHQELMLVSDMTVAENLALGALPTRHGLVDWDKVYEDARRTVERARIDIDVRAKITDLGVGRRQLAEIAKAVGKRSRVLILDEPTAALTEREVEHLLELVKSYRDEGISCVYISHKLDEVFAVADRITVLRDGSTIVTHDAKDLTQNDIIRYMVGREVDDLFPRRKSEPKEPILRVKNLNVGLHKDDKPVLKDISFEVRAGEVLGIGGLMGAGRSETLMHLFGAFGVRISGDVELAGEKIGSLPNHRQRHRPRQ
jgi:D-xylose transport system ATP-binding protein